MTVDTVDSSKCNCNSPLTLQQEKTQPTELLTLHMKRWEFPAATLIDTELFPYSKEKKNKKKWEEDQAGDSLRQPLRR